MTVIEKVNAIVCSQLDVELGSFSETDHFIDDMAADSMDLAELMIQVEQAFKLKIPAEVAQSLRCVRALVEYLHQNSPVAQSTESIPA